MPRIVQCHGCFDPLHIGHIRHFQAAKKAGDKLIVTVTADRFVNKGPGRPVFSEAIRMEAIQALACVDEVRLSGHPTAAESIREIRPAVFAKGPDYSEQTLDPGERQALADVGAELVITETQKWSSTALLQRPALSQEAEAYLARMRAQYSAADVKHWMDKALALKVLVVGDAIRDEYVYCDTLGKSGKDPMLAAQFVRAEWFAGGVLAVDNHVVSMTGRHSLVRSGPTTVKRRFIERYPFQKLFEVYEMDERAANEHTPDLLEVLPKELERADLVIVADYGHGLLTPPVIELITQKAKYLAVNTQANAGNHGFNTISKYPQADFISLSEREVRLDARDQQSDVERLAVKASRTHGARVLVTRGEKGCIGVSVDDYAVAPVEHSSSAPALTTHAVDRTGAGDAVFAVTACLASVGMPLDLLTFMASVVGTQAVGIVGNARYIERESLVASVETWLS